MKVEFKDLYIQALPDPKAESRSVQRPGLPPPDGQGAGTGERKYTRLRPDRATTGRRPMPAVLFLHGSGERGDDGIQGGQIGLGAAILAHPERFPALVVLPQATKTWQADSDDAKAALAALDDVTATYKVDPAGRPDRPVDGRVGHLVDRPAIPERVLGDRADLRPGEVERPRRSRRLPTWTVVGDLDGDATVQNLRADGPGPPRRRGAAPPDRVPRRRPQ